MPDFANNGERSMRSTFPLAGLTALGALAATFSAQPVAAQYYYPAPRVYAPSPPPPPAPAIDSLRNVDAAVRSLGLRPVSHVRIRGPVLVVDAVGQEGSLVRVSLDRYSGRVIQLVRVGRSAPEDAPVPSRAEPYDAADEEDFADYEPAPPYGSGPSVITRQGVEARDLPSRSPEITNSIPRNVLNGVPKEFRDEQARPAPQQRLAARTPEAAPRSAPLPKPRPSDAPTVAQTEAKAPPASAAKPTPAKPALTPEAKQDVEKFPPAQGFE
jgi:hypothetical protein